MESASTATTQTSRAVCPNVRQGQMGKEKHPVSCPERPPLMAPRGLLISSFLIYPSTRCFNYCTSLHMKERESSSCAKKKQMKRARRKVLPNKASPRDELSSSLLRPTVGARRWRRRSPRQVRQAVSPSGRRTRHTTQAVARLSVIEW